jgi:spore germination cell wall hydrolase CwlJ-like protein
MHNFSTLVAFFVFLGTFIESNAQMTSPHHIALLGKAQLATIEVNPSRWQVPPEITEEQIIVAMTILAEARGEGNAGMYAVAACIKVRAQERRLGYHDVCLQPWQFSCWNKNDPNRKKMVSFLKLPQARYALRLSTNMKKINTKFIGHANHYMTIKLWRTGKVKWAKGKKPCAFAGSHVFFKL